MNSQTPSTRTKAFNHAAQNATSNTRALQVLFLLLIASTLTLCACGVPGFADVTDSGLDLATTDVKDTNSTRNSDTDDGFRPIMRPDTYLDSALYHCLEVYDRDYLYMIYGDEEDEVTLQDLFEAVDSNKGIPSKFRFMLHDYCRAVVELYPDAELRPFRDNLQTLRIEEVPKSEVEKVSNKGSLGCYARYENVVYLPDDYDYAWDSWQHQMFYHEMSHCLRTRCYVEDGKDIAIQFEGLTYTNNVVAEALNSLFAVSLLDHKQENITYQLQSNYIEAMLSCLDDYDLEDYVNHSESYFVAKLDEFNRNTEGMETLNLMQEQYEEYHGIGRDESDGDGSTTYVVDAEKYWPICDYIAKMYYKAHVDPGMSDEEKEAVADELVALITRNAPWEYNVDPDRLRESFFACEAE